LTFTRSIRRPTPGWSGIRMAAKNWFFTVAHTTGAVFSMKGSGALLLKKPAPESASRRVNDVLLPS
jgi:hypothetical protein